MEEGGCGWSTRSIIFPNFLLISSLELSLFEDFEWNRQAAFAQLFNRPSPPKPSPLHIPAPQSIFSISVPLPSPAAGLSLPTASSKRRKNAKVLKQFSLTQPLHLQRVSLTPPLTLQLVGLTPLGQSAASLMSPPSQFSFLRSLRCSQIISSDLPQVKESEQADSLSASPQADSCCASSKADSLSGSPRADLPSASPPADPSSASLQTDTLSASPHSDPFCVSLLLILLFEHALCHPETLEHAPCCPETPSAHSVSIDT